MQNACMWKKCLSLGVKKNQKNNCSAQCRWLNIFTGQQNHRFIYSKGSEKNFFCPSKDFKIFNAGSIRINIRCWLFIPSCMHIHWNPVFNTLSTNGILTFKSMSHKIHGKISQHFTRRLITSPWNPLEEKCL